MDKISSFQLFNKSTRRIKVLGFSLVSVIAIIGFAYYIAVISPMFAKAYTGAGNGQQDNPYLVTNCSQLQEIKKSLFSHYALINDIDCSATFSWNDGKGFEPIFNFAGQFDGRNYEIKDLYINRPDEDNVGFFSRENNNYVNFSNVRFTKSEVNANRIDINGGNNVGAVAGFFMGHLFNVHNDLNIRANGKPAPGDPNMTVGGLIGQSNAEIRASSNSGTISVGGSDRPNRSVSIGGITGQMYAAGNGNNANPFIDDSYSNGRIDAGSLAQAPSGACGGLVGAMFTNDPNTSANIRRSYSSGSLNCVNQSGSLNAGGFIGYINVGATASTAPQIVESFTNTRVNSPGDQTSSNAFYGNYTENPNNTNMKPNLSTNSFDATRTGKTTCGSAINLGIDCTAVNVDGLSPDYFTNQSKFGNFFNNWNQGVIWDISEPYPRHKTFAVKSEKPTNLRAERDGSDYKLTWNEPIGTNGRATIKSYQIFYFNENSPNGWQEYDGANKTPAGQTTRNIVGLDIPGKYKFKINAQYSDGQTNFYDSQGFNSDVFAFSAGMPANAPQNVRTTPGARSVKLDWDPVVGATKYNVQYRVVGQTNWQNRLTSDDANTATTVHIGDNKSFEYRVSGTNQAGNGPWSNIVSTTLTEPINYTVTNCQELQNINNDITGNYTLANDIDCSDIENFEPIALNVPFLGNFNGNGRTISNLTIQKDVEADNTDFNGVGLFGIVIGGKIQNVTLSNATVVGNYLIDESVDKDGDGLPDVPNAPEVPPIDPVTGLPTNRQQAEELVNENGQVLSEAGQAFLGNAGVTSNELGIAANSFPRFATGGLIGTLIGNGTYSNLKFLNSSVQGSIAGGVIGAVIPLPDLDNAALQLIDNGVQDPSTIIGLLNQSVILDNLQSSGLVNGFIGGGLVGVGMSAIGNVVGAGGELVIQNSSTTAEVEANMGGGVIGGALSPSVFSIAAYFVLFEGDNNFNLDYLKSSIAIARDVQSVIIRNTKSSGLISACNAWSELRLASLGGIVGAGVGVLVQDSQSTSDVRVCSASTQERVMYGGITGGVGGVLLESRIDNSSSSGKVEARRNTGEYEFENAIYIGSSGGLAGVFITVENDSNGEYAINNSRSTGDINIAGKNGMLSFTGGLVGINIGSSTISNSYNSGKITTSTRQENVGAISVSGGLTGFSIGVDAEVAYNAGTSIPFNEKLPKGTSHGLDINNSYSTGDVITNKDPGSGIIAVTGGAAGIMIGQATITNSYASGKVVSNIPEEFKLGLPQSQVTSTFDLVKAQNFGTAISGGLVGSAYGIDLPRVATSVNTLVGIINAEDIIQTQGIVIDNSHASGEVKANVAGGLMGSAELEVKINKAYSEGAVRGEIIGGLIGQSGLVSSGGLVGLGFGVSSFVDGISSQNLPDKDHIALLEYGGSVFDQVLEGIGPVEITNTYNTGTLTAVPFSIDVTAALSGEISNNDNTSFIPDFKINAATDSTQEKIVPVRLPTIAGGIVGFYMVPGGIIKDSYSSGAINVLPLPDVNRNPKIKLADIPSFAGGIFGIDVSVPSLSIKKTLTAVSREGGFSSLVFGVDDMVSQPTRLENVFSASKLNLQDSTFTGGTAGWYISPAQAINTFVFGNSDKVQDITSDNVYMDRNNISTSTCSGPNIPTLDVAQKLITNSRIEVNDQGTNVIPPIDLKDDEQFPKEIRQEVEKILGLKTACNYVNEGNTQPNYFKSNKTNTPMNSWNFNNTWVVVDNDYPKFVGGVNTNNSSQTVTKPVITTKVNPQKNPQVRRVLLKLGEINPNKEQVKGLKAILASIPVFLAKSIPYSLIFMLLVLATMYSWQALKEYRQLSNLRRNIAKIIATKESIDNYLAITTHYLNTPVAIMSGAVELLVSLKKISEARADILTSKIKKFSSVAGELIIANQVSNAKSTNDEMLIKRKQESPLKAKAVWMPAFIAFGLIAVANALFIWADVFNESPYRLIVEFGIFVLAVFLVAIAYKYRNFLAEAKDLAKHQLEMESDLYKKRAEFIPKISALVDESFESLNIASTSLKKIKESKLYFNGLNMLEEINKGLKKIRKFSTFETDAPLFDITAYLEKSVEGLKESADAKKLTINAKINNGIVSRIQPDEIHQIVDSVLNNAVKFSKEGGNIDVLLYKRFNKIFLTIGDEGIGISDAKLTSLLKPFTRATESMEYNYEGMGLALYTDNIIANKLGGKIAIKSQVSKGTIITVVLPVVKASEDVAPVLITPEASSTPTI